MTEKTADVKKNSFILGIDLGTNSLGWCLVAVERDPEGRWVPRRIERMGVRIFEAGMDNLEEGGRGESRALARRTARLARRRLERLKRRLRKVRNLLVRAGLLPADFPAGPLGAADPYKLRAKALDEPLEPYELGRVFYHLAQRRGFKSNRKADTTDKEAGTVDKNIGELESAIRQAGCRTLGEYLSKLDPHQQRLRGRYTSRAMYEDEFEKIVSAQAPHHPVLTDDFRRALRRAIFFQRPLKSARGLIGRCALEPRCRRAAVAGLLFQRYRILQQVNDTQITLPCGTRRPLTPDERFKLIKALEDSKKLSFAKAKKIMGLPAGTTLNYEAGGREEYPGDETSYELRKIFGARWDAMPPSERDEVVHDLLSIDFKKALERRGRDRWGLGAEEAQKFANISLTPGYSSLSSKAMRKLLPLMEQGMPAGRAREQLYPRSVVKPVDALPPVEDPRNPVVRRALTELRKVVNAVVRNYGLPEQIRVELARDVKKNSKQREKIAKADRAREKVRREAAEKIISETTIRQPRPADKDKVLLADECGWQCPYTGKGFGWEHLFGPHPQVDIEHIIPFDRSLDDSLANKTLCFAEENRNVKRGRTPAEAYAADPERWKAILDRVRAFKSRDRNEKLFRFQLQGAELDEWLHSFRERQLNDTAYAAKLAASYLGRLYGGEVDAQGVRRVRVSSGRLTGWLRNEWGLNAVLGDGPEKSRDDHRHHAVDALAIALTDERMVRALAEAASRASGEGRRRFGRVPEPWPDFLKEVRARVAEIIVSPRVDRRVNGALHEESLYSPRIRHADGREYVHIRKRLDTLTKQEVEAIVDPAVREAVERRLREVGETEPRKAFSRPENLPVLRARDGRQTIIRKARIRKPEVPIVIGQGSTRRYVLSEHNHHVEIFEEKTRSGRIQWKGRVVSLLEARRRLLSGGPVVDQVWEGRRFVFSLAPGEVVALSADGGERRLYRCRSVSISATGRIELAFSLLHDARLKKEIVRAGALERMSPEGLRKRAVMDPETGRGPKYVVTPLGELRSAND